MPIINSQPHPADFQGICPHLRGLPLGDLRHDVGFVSSEPRFFTGHGFAPPVNAEDQQQGPQNSGDSPAHYRVHVTKFHIEFLCLDLDKPDEAEPKDQQYAGDPEVGFEFR
ncbi:hypothetical protein D3C81_1213680 [compost metagenome]